ncbi:glycosyl transferase [Bacillus pseudomycoides]|nr:Glycosyltransferase, MGT [Bacillus pseudomycoides]EEM08315.1 Glycosyltransferase, MGT [Bacillus pseudomycoides]PEK29438.1 glycosyl transferase [Bacillus pseudomycoides]PEK60900.1 glycosyl transferase [Bacillus pseudomycoides]PEP34619.1 glycosyl transferase [Bacillus pseudomycoides]
MERFFMSKALVINFPAEGHINPTIGLVNELVNRGEEVIYYCEEEYRHKLKNIDVEFRNYGDYLKEINLKNRMKDMFHPLQMMYRFLRVTENAIPFLLEEITREKYDYMIYDQHFLLGRILAEMLPIPTIASCTTFAMNKEMLEGIPLGNIESNPTSPLVEECQMIVNRISDRYGVNVDSLEQLFHYESDMTLVFTSKYFQPHAHCFNHTFKFIGPSITSRQEIVEFPLYRLDGKEVIYISMGTELNKQPEFYEKCLHAFKEFNGIVVISVGKEIEMRRFLNMPPHFIIRPYVPQLEVLKYTDVFITHGGMNSVSEGLYYDTPLVVLPITNDQPFVAKRVEDLNAGLTLDYTKITSDLLKETVRNVLNNKTYREGSKIIGQSLREAGGCKKAVDAIFQFKREFLSSSLDK